MATRWVRGLAVLAFVALCASGWGASASGQHENRKRVHLTLASPEEIEQARSLGGTSLACHDAPGESRWIVPPDAVEVLSAIGIPVLTGRGGWERFRGFPPEPSRPQPPIRRAPLTE